MTLIAGNLLRTVCVPVRARPRLRAHLLRGSVPLVAELGQDTKDRIAKRGNIPEMLQPQWRSLLRKPEL